MARKYHFFLLPARSQSFGIRPESNRVTNAHQRLSQLEFILKMQDRRPFWIQTTRKDQTENGLALS